MIIRTLELLEGARRARGLTVIIDVFRAFSVASYVMGNGAREIIPVGDIQQAYDLKARFPEAVLIGERGGKKCPGFDYGNSPAEVLPVDFTGKTVIQTTGAGTQGVVNAAGADEILGGSFPMAGAILRYIRMRRPEEVSLVAMGTRGQVHSDEDTLFARYLTAHLQGTEAPTMEEIRAHLRHYPSAEKFFDPQADWAPEQDFDLCLQADRFPFVLKLDCEPSTSQHCFRRVDV
ncbi:2-phosphosulfolactate phosphatase [Dysosmobacter sp.]|uniref:2-phosphosulfolactate phosphatase n=1 Tax=Dysosmobacter sp. TaxID=2591382 RepID=UPI002A8E2583|nr:2-phosphosulfolactate phosphatase [Dysosmobacter sp.]MDY3282464.1 2-phosphosulfolactate phosphatase [Dysosmobacter sp.]